MAATANLELREVLNQVVNDPQYHDVASVPLVSWHQVMVILLAYFGTGLGIVGYLHWGMPLWLCYFIMIPSMYAGFTPLHDGTHRAVSRNKWVNDILGTISAQVIFPGLNMPAYRALHLEHHMYVGDKKRDPDEGLVKLPKFLSYSYLLFVDFHWAKWYLTQAWDKWPKNLRPWVLGSLIGLAVIYSVGLLSPYWKEFILLFVIPHRLALVWLSYAFAHIQHPDGLSWDKQPFQATVKVKAGRLLKLFLFGQADHTMHHLLPHVPWYKYHKVWGLANGILYRQNVPERGLFTGPKRLNPAVHRFDVPVKVRVTAVKDVGFNVKSFELTPMQGEKLFEFLPGSHVSLHLPSGQVRQYSLLNDCAERNRYQIAVKKEEQGRGGSLEVHQTLQPGSIVSITGPKNNFFLYENQAHYVLISGGIGITPLLAMAHRLHALGKSFEFHVCARSEADIPFVAELEHIPFADSISVHVDSNGKSSLDLEAVIGTPRSDGMVYICGPGGFMDWVKSTALERGWEPRRVRLENFSAGVAADNAENAEFSLRLHRSGREIKVLKTQTVIDALHHHDIAVPYSCLQGTCGTCIMPVVEGAVEHRDAFLTDDEKADNKAMCLCVSRAQGDSLTVDLGKYDKA